ncbi:MAG: PAS domain S-box protein, partial [Bacteroidales bacterium]|nr:PAS domain S-box protein [Bacteroidales bacterium]
MNKFSLKQLYLLGFIVHVVTVLLMFTLPESHKKEAFQLISLTIVGVFPFVSLLVGKILSDQEQNLLLLKSLKESEEQYRLLVTHQTDLVVKVDAQNRLSYVSPSYCRLFGKTEKELLGSSFTPLIHEEDRQPTLDAMEQLKHPPHTAYIEQRVATPIGYRWLAWADKAVVDKNGQLEAIIGVGRDISERKNAEIDRERSEERYRHLFNASPIGIILEDVEGLILDVNETLCKDYGYEAGDLIGQNISILAPEQTRHQVT